LADELIKHGYKKYSQHWHHEDYILGKRFHKDDNPWDEDRNGNFPDKHGNLSTEEKRLNDKIEDVALKEGLKYFFNR
jgi:hypothetical protein